jgi:hypothetical protein
LARFTSSGINTILEFEIDEFEEYHKAAMELYKLEMEIPKLVILKGIAEN